MRHYNLIDKLIHGFDNCLKLLPTSLNTTDNNESDLSVTEKQQSISMLRVNHCGEVCAQVLYKSQALFARDLAIKNKLHQSAIEETTHLNWCKTRLVELQGKTSYLTPFFGLGAFCIGSIFSLAGDKWNLSFLAETEHQVTTHLGKQLELLPSRDTKTQAILRQMQIDESQHATTAEEYGAIPLPTAIKFIMRSCAKIMTTSTQYI